MRQNHTKSKRKAATEADVEPSKTPRIRFNPEINLGHILQIIALTGAVTNRICQPSARHGFNAS